MRAPSRRPATWTAVDVGGLCGKTSPPTLENSALVSSVNWTMSEQRTRIEVCNYFAFWVTSDVPSLAVLA